MTIKPRLAVIHPYWDFWEHTAPRGFRQDRLELVNRLVEPLTDLAEVVAIAEVASAEDGERVARTLAAHRPPAVLVVQSMATPPSHALPVLDALGDIPVVIWGLQETSALREDLGHREITVLGATVGAPMLSNVLSRRGRHFALELGFADRPDDAARLRRTVRVALAAGRLQQARLGRVGRPIPGYLQVDLDVGELRRVIGTTVVDIDPGEILERFQSISDQRVNDLDAEVRRDWDLIDDVDADAAMARSLRVALAIEDLAADHALDAGSVNCHVPQIRFSPEIGATPCFGLGRLTSAGIPWTCTGDLVTAVAMLASKALGHAALYHEIEAADHDADEVVLANSGEHDLAWLAPGERPRLRRNGWFCGVDLRCGVCGVFEPAVGPATLVGFTPHADARSGFRFVTARGELTTRRFPETGTPNGGFRFTAGPVAQAWAAWARAGVNHHSSASPGAFADEVAELAAHLGVDCVTV